MTNPGMLRLSRSAAQQEIISRCKGDYALVDGVEWIRDPDTDEYRPYRSSDTYYVMSRQQDAINRYIQQEADSGRFYSPYDVSERMSEILRQHMTYLNVIDTYMSHVKSCKAAWDGLDRISTLGQCIGLYADVPGGADYIKALGYALAIGPVERRTAVFDQDIIPILISAKQGIGKTSTLKALAFSDKFFNSSKGAIERDNGRAFTLRAEMAVVTEFAEIDSLFRRNDNSFLKSLVSESKNLVDVKYERQPREVYFRSFFAGTSNALRFLTDSSGNRRYAPVHMREVDRTAPREVTDTTSPIFLFDHPEYVNQIIGQAAAMIEQGAHWDDLLRTDVVKEAQRQMCEAAMSERAGLDIVVEAMQTLTAGTDRAPWKEVKQYVYIHSTGYNARTIEDTLADVFAHSDRFGVEIKPAKLNNRTVRCVVVTDRDKLNNCVI